MRRFLGKSIKWLLLLILVLAIALLSLRAYRSLGGPALKPWHTFVPVELTVDEMDAADWGRYLAQEDAIMASVRAEVSQKLPPDERVPINRYFEASPVYAERFARNWNRSYVMEPDGKPVGAVVLLHGLTDSPYSLRHVAKRYRDQGFVAIGIRIPAHGTVPAGLSDVDTIEVPHRQEGMTMVQILTPKKDQATRAKEQSTRKSRKEGDAAAKATAAVGKSESGE